MGAPWDICIVSMSTVAYDARTLNIARSFARDGYRVCLLGWGKAPTNQLLQRFGITGFLRRQPAVRRARWQWITLALWTLRHWRRIRACAYWAADLYALPLATLLARYYRARLFYDSRELFFALAALRRRPLMQRFHQWLEACCIGSVERCIVSGQRDAEALQQRYRLREPPLVLLNLPPYRVPARTDLLRHHLRLPDHSIVLLYQGAVHEGRGLEQGIGLLCRLPEAVLCILGDGVHRSALERMAMELRVADRVHWLGWRPYEELLEWTASADIGLALIEPLSRSYELALPNKVFEYCMAGIPTIATDLPALRELFDQYRIGIVLPTDFTLEELHRAVRTLHIPEVWHQYHKRCREAATHLCWEVQHPRLVQLLASMPC